LLRQRLPVGVKIWLKPWYYRILGAFVSDKQFTKQAYKRTFGREVNLIAPRRFTEKIQYLKLNNHQIGLSRLVDKYEVRQHIKELGLADILNQLYGVYERGEDIKIGQLPDSFVIKMTHGSGWNIVCPDKNKLQWDIEQAKLRSWQKENFYYHTREWAYKNIQPRIIVEKYLQDGSGPALRDYKIFCFNGKPEMIGVDIDRFTDHRRNLYDLEWNLLPWRYIYPNASQVIPKLACLDDMLEVAKKLSQGLFFARIDLYVIQEKIIFGEITLTPHSGFGRFYPDEKDLAMGERMDISALLQR
jgi:hypothetical protein